MALTIKRATAKPDLWQQVGIPALAGAVGTGALSGLASLGAGDEKETPSQRRRRILKNVLLGVGIGGLGTGAAAWGINKVQHPGPQLQGGGWVRGLGRTIADHPIAAGIGGGVLAGAFRNRGLVPRNLNALSGKAHGYLGKNLEAFQKSEQAAQAAHRQALNAYDKQLAKYEKSPLIETHPGTRPTDRTPGVAPIVQNAGDIPLTAKLRGGPGTEFEALRSKLTAGIQHSGVSDPLRARIQADEMLHGMGGRVEDTIMRNPQERMKFLSGQANTIDKGVGWAMRKFPNWGGNRLGSWHGQMFRPALNVDASRLGSAFGTTPALMAAGGAGGWGLDSLVNSEPGIVE